MNAVAEVSVGHPDVVTLAATANPLKEVLADTIESVATPEADKLKSLKVVEFCFEFIGVRIQLPKAHFPAFFCGSFSPSDRSDLSYGTLFSPSTSPE